jgi:uncharacterized repeat protein (TIGR03803 family)
MRISFMRIVRALVLAALPSLAFAQQRFPVQVLHGFTPSPSRPNGPLIQVPGGDFYGVALDGIYRLAPGGQVTAIAGPRFPMGALVRASDGKLYGTARSDDDLRGTVFRFDPLTLETRTLHVFGGANEGWYPLGGLVEVGGQLYGVTQNGGSHDRGTLFQLDPGTGTLITRYHFGDRPAPAAWQPTGPLALGPDGRLYGTTFFSDPGGHGAIYRFDPVSGTFAIVHQFTEAEGKAPVGPLGLDVDGMFYGAATGGGGPDIAGTIFRFDPVSTAVTVLHVLDPGAGHGRNPGPVTIGADGHLYGTTRFGAANGDPRTLFRLRRLPGPAYTYDVIGTLDAMTAGGDPPVALTAGADGRLYGFSSTGGTVDAGFVFRFDLPPAGPPPSPVTLVVVHDFRPTTVSQPSTPVRANDGLLYGTVAGGPNLNGAVYRLHPATGAVTILGDLPAAFPGTTNVSSTALVLGADGLLYGTATSYLPGSFENRVIRVNPATGLATLAAYRVGSLPTGGYSVFSGLVRTPAGTLYGIRTTQAGAQVFRFDPQTNAIVDVATTTASSTTVSGLLAAADGQLYAGTVRRFDVEGNVGPVPRFDADLQRVNLTTGAFESVAVLARSVGAFSVGAPVQGPAGTLYLTTSDGAAGSVLRVQLTDGAQTTVCGTGGVLVVAPDGDVVGYRSSFGLTSLFRCHPATGATVAETMPVAVRPEGPLALIDGAIYGVSGRGAYPGGAIWRIVATGTLPDLDSDNDFLPNTWETANGLDPFSAVGDDGTTGDPDHDGLTNTQEHMLSGTHPRGTLTRYFAEGATGPFFQTAIDLVNPHESTPATVQLRFFADSGAIVRQDVFMDANSRVRIDPATLPGLAHASFSTIVESDVELGVDRLMRWDATGYGSHLESGVLAPATTWHFAEGSTSGDFALFYLLQNPQQTSVVATIRYLRPFGQAPIEKQYTLPPLSRTTIVVDAEGPELSSTDLSAVITAAAPIVAERAMYLSRPGQPFMAGHSSAGVTAPAPDWFFAEGATGAFFDLFLLLSNPNPTPATVDVEYLRTSGGSLTKTYQVPANGRVTIWVDDEQLPAGSGQRPLANAALSIRVQATNGVPIVAERTMWWPGPELTANFWYEAHNSPGATATATRWAIGGGDIDRPNGSDTFVLLANPTTTPARVRVSTYFGEGRTFPIERDYDLPAKSRTTLALGDLQPATSQHVAVLVESLGLTPVPIVVEHATYASVGGVTWSSGGNALATPLP